MRPALPPAPPPDERIIDTDFGLTADHAIMKVFMSRPGFLLARVDQISTALHGEIAAGETLAQAEFLLLLDAVGAAPQIALAHAAGVDKSTTAYILDNLEARGWAERTADAQDRRRAAVALTDEGASRVVRIRAQYAELQRRLTAPFDSSSADRLLALLLGIASNPSGLAPFWAPTGEESGVALFDRAPSFLCRRALQLFQAQFIACTRSLNLTPRQFSLLHILSVQHEITQVGFARLFGLDPSTCAVVMRNLAARALIASSPMARDRRARVYWLTEPGRRCLVEARPMVDRSERLVFRGESANDIRWLVRQLQEIVRRHSHRLRFPGAITTG